MAPVMEEKKKKSEGKDKKDRDPTKEKKEKKEKDPSKDKEKKEKKEKDSSKEKKDKPKDSSKDKDKKSKDTKDGKSSKKVDEACITEAWKPSKPSLFKFGGRSILAKLHHFRLPTFLLKHPDKSDSAHPDHALLDRMKSPMALPDRHLDSRLRRGWCLHHPRSRRMIIWGTSICPPAAARMRVRRKSTRLYMQQMTGTTSSNPW